MATSYGYKDIVARMRQRQREREAHALSRNPYKDIPGELYGGGQLLSAIAGLVKGPGEQRKIGEFEEFAKAQDERQRMMEEEAVRQANLKTQEENKRITREDAQRMWAGGQDPLSKYTPDELEFAGLSLQGEPTLESLAGEMSTATPGGEQAVMQQMSQQPQMSMTPEESAAVAEKQRRAMGRGGMKYDVKTVADTFRKQINALPNEFRGMFQVDETRLYSEGAEVDYQKRYNQAAMANAYMKLGKRGKDKLSTDDMWGVRENAIRSMTQVLGAKSNLLANSWLMDPDDYQRQNADLDLVFNTNKDSLKEANTFLKLQDRFTPADYPDASDMGKAVQAMQKQMQASSLRGAQAGAVGALSSPVGQKQDVTAPLSAAPASSDAGRGRQVGKKPTTGQAVSTLPPAQAGEGDDAYAERVIAANPWLLDKYSNEELEKILNEAYRK